MRKFNLELPKYRLQLHMKLVKRRKPLLDPENPLIPSVKEVNKKYRTGTIIGKVARHIGEHKSARKFFAANFAVLAMASTFVPSIKASSNITPDENIISVQNPINTQKGIQMPLDSYRLNQSFSFYHPGIDMGDPIGTPIKPIKPGVVIFAGYVTDGYGNKVLIDHGQGLETLYAHLSKIEVKVGQIVTMQTEIGKIGVTGHSTGPHLHFEIHENGKAINPFSILAR